MMNNELSRSEMKNVMAGTDFRTVGCNKNDAHLGYVGCSEDISDMTCCKAHHPETDDAYTLPEKA